METGNVSNRQQPEQRSEISLRPLMSLQHSENLASAGP